MRKKITNLGLHSSPPRLNKTAEQRQAQWLSGPKLLGPSIAAQLMQRGKATKAPKSFEPTQPG